MSTLVNWNNKPLLKKVPGSKLWWCLDPVSRYIWSCCATSKLAYEAYKTFGKNK